MKSKILISLFAIMFLFSGNCHSVIPSIRAVPNVGISHSLDPQTSDTVKKKDPKKKKNPSAVDMTNVQGTTGTVLFPDEPTPEKPWYEDLDWRDYIAKLLTGFFIFIALIFIIIFRKKIMAIFNAGNSMKSHTPTNPPPSTPNNSNQTSNTKTNMKFCSQCGKQIPDNAKFCSVCGERQ